MLDLMFSLISVLVYKIVYRMMGGGCGGLLVVGWVGGGGDIYYDYGPALKTNKHFASNFAEFQGHFWNFEDWLKT